MSVWTDRPDDRLEAQAFKIMRTPAGRPIEGIIISKNLIGTKLHYWHGRSKPCNGNDCEACFAGQQPRWKGYILLKAQATSTIVIFEFTERAFNAFDAFSTEYGNLRGAQMHATRLNGKSNGPLQVTFKQGRIDETLLPKECDLKSALERIWELTKKTIPFRKEEVYDKTLDIKEHLA